MVIRLAQMDVTPMGGGYVEMYHTRLDWISHIIRSEARQMLDTSIHSQPRDFFEYLNIRSLNASWLTCWDPRTIAIVSSMIENMRNGTSGGIKILHSYDT